MNAATFDHHGGPDVLRLTEVAVPALGPRDVVIEVVGAGVNNADLLQREGRYALPAGAPPILGLECSGRVVAVGEYVANVAVGDAVVALLPGGGYAERVVVPAGLVLPAPAGVDLLSAAALPEAACTVVSALGTGAGLRAGETLLMHGGTSGIGTFAIQWAKAMGATVITTSGSDDKCAVAVGLGADVAVNYRDGDFVAATLAATDGRGADVVLDVVGASYLDRNLDALAEDGRLVVIGSEGGTSTGQLDLRRLMTKRASITGSTLRSRPHGQRVAIMREVGASVWPLVERGQIRSSVQQVFPLAAAADAHTALAAGSVMGKLVLDATPRADAFTASGMGGSW
jgi:putative PIG3 family NAD(P)H quinone oxidoreductase